MAGFYNDPRFDITLPFTRRRVLSYSATANTICLEIISPMPTVNVGDWMKVEDVATWANGYYQVTSKSTGFLYLRKNGLAAKSKVTVSDTSRARVIRWAVATNGSFINPGFSEVRRLSNWFNYDTTLGQTTTMCVKQNQVKDILTQFWNRPEIVREYKVKQYMNVSNWTGYGPGGGGTYGLNKMVNACMCIIHGSSGWNTTCVGGINESGLVSNGCSTYEPPTSGFDYSKILDSYNIGLWAIFPLHSEFANAPWNPGIDGYNYWNWFTNPEYNTRAALWMMFNRLFNDADFSTSTLNPFSVLPAAKWDPSTKTFINTRTQACWGVGCSKCPPYGTSSCL